MKNFALLIFSLLVSDDFLHLDFSVAVKQNCTHEDFVMPNASMTDCDTIVVSLVNFMFDLNETIIERLYFRVMYFCCCCCCC